MNIFVFLFAASYFVPIFLFFCEFLLVVSLTDQILGFIGQRSRLGKIHHIHIHNNYFCNPVSSAFKVQKKSLTMTLNVQRSRGQSTLDSSKIIGDTVLLICKKTKKMYSLSLVRECFQIYLGIHCDLNNELNVQPFNRGLYPNYSSKSQQQTSLLIKISDEQVAVIRVFTLCF